LLLNFALEYAIRTVQTNLEGLKQNDTNQLLACADDINSLGECIHPVKKNTEALLVIRNEISLEVGDKKNNYTFTCHEQTAT